MDPIWYDKDGQPIDMYRANELLGDPDYKRLALDHIGPYHVSTVWLGVNYNFSRHGPPIIFETMVFVGDGVDDSLGMDMYIDRYCTEAAARRGHDEIITMINATLQTQEEAISNVVQPEGSEESTRPQ